MVTVFALAAALLYGSSDFLGGAATRRAHVLSVLGISATAGAIVAAAAALLVPGPPQAAGLAWGACAGVAGAVGFVFFYAGLAAGPMGVVAPVSALAATVIPVAAALAIGERPGPRVYLGASVCIAAIALVSARSGGPADAPAARSGLAVDGPAARSGLAVDGPAARSGLAVDAAAVRGGQAGTRGAAMNATARGVSYGIASGVAFGVFFLFIRNGGESGGLWAVAAARAAETLLILAGAAAIRARPVTWRSGGTFLAALGAGAGDVGANVCYVLATRAGLFGLAVVLTSLYPGVTVLLARLVLGEHVGWARSAGLALAAAGVLLVTGLAPAAGRVVDARPHEPRGRGLSRSASVVGGIRLALSLLVVAPEEHPTNL
jgi:drug/metabolite transporter (DMT)-like permease